MDDYIEDGQVHLELNHYAFLGPESVRAAEAAYCANDQDMFWDYHETLFLNQQTPPHNNGGFSEDRLIAIGEEVGIDDMDTFESCVSDREHESAVAQEVQEAESAGVSGTPQFRINDGDVFSLESYEDLQQRIDAELP